MDLRVYRRYSCIVWQCVCHTLPVDAPTSSGGTPRLNPYHDRSGKRYNPIWILNCRRFYSINPSRKAPAKLLDISKLL